MKNVKGRLDRARNVQIAEYKSKNQLRATFLQWVADAKIKRPLLSSIMTPSDYAAEISFLREHINDGSFSPNERRWLFYFFAAHSQDCIKRYGIKGVDPIKPPIISRRPATNRTEKGFQASIGLNNWNHAFETSILGMRHNQTDVPEQWLGLALWSAMKHGHLIETQLVKALHMALLGHSPIFHIGLMRRLAVRLYIPKGSQQKHKNKNTATKTGNVYAEGVLARIHYYHPDPLTATLIYQWLKTRPKDLIPQSKLNNELTFLTIKRALSLAESDKKKFSSLKALTRHMIWLADDKHDNAISEALLTVSDGR